MRLNSIFIAARWIVCGIHLIRASVAENLIPSIRHFNSNTVINVSLLLALSIITAIISVSLSKLHDGLCFDNTLSWILYVSNVDQTTAAIFSPECCPINSWKSMSSSSGKNVIRGSIIIIEIFTTLPVICDVMSNNGQKCVAIAGCPGIERKTNLALQCLIDRNSEKIVCYNL